MRTALRRRLPTLGGLVVVLALLLFAAADEGDMYIDIVCPSQVVAGQPIIGFVTDYTPPVLLSAIGKGGMQMPGTPRMGNGSTTWFNYPTTESMAGSVVLISASDSVGKVGNKAVVVE